MGWQARGCQKCWRAARPCAHPPAASLGPRTDAVHGTDGHGDIQPGGAGKEGGHCGPQPAPRRYHRAARHEVACRRSSSGRVCGGTGTAGLAGILARTRGLAAAPATPPSGLDSACIIARPSVMAPSCLGVALKDAPTQLYTAGRICSSHCSQARDVGKLGPHPVRRTDRGGGRAVAVAGAPAGPCGFRRTPTALLTSRCCGEQRPAQAGQSALLKGHKPD